MNTGTGIDLSTTWHFNKLFCCISPCCEAREYYVSKHGVIEPWNECLGLPDDAVSSHLRLRQLAIQSMIKCGLSEGKATEILDKEVRLLDKAVEAKPVELDVLERITSLIKSLANMVLFQESKTP
jgi:hypothetical protein